MNTKVTIDYKGDNFRLLEAVCGFVPNGIADWVVLTEENDVVYVETELAQYHYNDDHFSMMPKKNIENHTEYERSRLLRVFVIFVKMIMPEEE